MSGGSGAPGAGTVIVAWSDEPQFHASRQLRRRQVGAVDLLPQLDDRRAAAGLRRRHCDESAGAVGPAISEGADHGRGRLPLHALAARVEQAAVRDLPAPGRRRGEDAEAIPAADVAAVPMNCARSIQPCTSSPRKSFAGSKTSSRARYPAPGTRPAAGAGVLPIIRIKPRAGDAEPIEHGFAAIVLVGPARTLSSMIAVNATYPVLL